MNTLKKVFSFDITLLVLGFTLSILGLISMYNEDNLYFFNHQIIWITLGVLVFLITSQIDFRFLRMRSTVISLFLFAVFLLLAVFIFGDVTKGAQSRFSLGAFAVQPSEFAKLVVIIVLAKYFNRRHMHIAQLRHIFISGLYAGVLFLLIMLQPDLGSAVMLFSVWAGIVFVSGISKKHIIMVLTILFTASFIFWNFGLQEYQKARIKTFLNPLSDIYGSGYNAYQSVIAVGSGGLFGKGIGYGTQSKLKFLPEYQTDFIFASFAEEWGFLGVILLFVLFGLLIGRILYIATYGESNFEKLFAVGVATLFMAHITVHVGMNMGLLPVTGITLPFLSYGGSHLLVEFLALGILSSMYRFKRLTPSAVSAREHI